MNYKIILSKLKSNLFRTFLQALSISASMIFCFLIFFAYKNIENYLIEKKVGDMQPGEFEITTINGGKKLEETNISSIKNFGIEPSLVYSMNLPGILEIDLFGQKMETDMIFYGVSENLLVPLDGKVPLGVSSSLLDLYNTQIAGGLYPNLNQQIFKTFNIKLLFGKSQIFPTKNITQKEGKVTTFSSKLPLAGVSLPLETMKQVLSGYENKPNLIKIIGIADDEKFEKIKQSFSGYVISSQKEKLQGVKESLENFRKVLYGGIILVVGFMVFVMIYNILSQKPENDKLFFIYRLHGARSGQLFSIIFVEGLVYILIGSLLIFLANKIFDTKNFEQKFFDFTHIQYNIKALNSFQMGQIVLFHLILLIGVSLLVNYKNIYKKFEN